MTSSQACAREGPANCDQYRRSFVGSFQIDNVTSSKNRVGEGDPEGPEMGSKIRALMTPQFRVVDVSMYVMYFQQLMTAPCFAQASVSLFLYSHDLTSRVGVPPVTPRDGLKYSSKRQQTVTAYKLQCQSSLAQGVLGAPRRLMVRPSCQHFSRSHCRWSSSFSLLDFRIVFENREAITDSASA